MPLAHDALALHRHLVYGYALRLLGDAADAADVTQDVLVRIWRHGGDVEPQRLRGWVLRVTRNACLDALRARKSRLGQLVSSGDDGYEPPCDGRAPDAELESGEFKQQLDAALDQLPEPQRSIVVLREIQGLPYRDIAEALDLPLTSIKVYLHRGRRRLRDALRSTVSAEDLLP